MAENLTPTKPSLRRIPQIELLRAAAMAGIFVFHLWSVVPNVVQDGLMGRLVGVASSYGYLGVVLFNVVSGFVLALPYLGPEQRGVPAYGHFLRRRFRRIVPKYYLVLAIWTTLLLLSAKGRSDGVLLPELLAHLAFVHSLLPSMFFSIVPAYWWLGLLAQFYLLFPVLLRLFKAVGAAGGCLLTCAGCWLSWAILDRMSQPGNAWAVVNYMLYFNLPARLPEFAMGMWLAEAWRFAAPPEKPVHAGWHRQFAPAFAAFAGAALLFAVAGSTVLSLDRLPFRHMCMVCWCLVVLVAVLVPKATWQFGQFPMVAKTAAASYSIYLLHQPLLGYANRWSNGLLAPLPEFWLLLIGVGAVSFALSVVLDRSVA